MLARHLDVEKAFAWTTRLQLAQQADEDQVLLCREAGLAAVHAADGHFQVVARRGAVEEGLLLLVLLEALDVLEVGELREVPREHHAPVSCSFEVSARHDDVAKAFAQTARLQLAQQAD